MICTCIVLYRLSTPDIIGNLSNYDDDHNDDFKTTIGLMSTLHAF